MENIEKKGLSDGNRRFLVILVEVALLIYGPIEPYGLTIRTVYLIAIPVLLWLILKRLGKMMDMDAKSNDRFARTLSGIIAGAFLVGAYLSLAAGYHSECAQYVGGRDPECVGEYKTVKGPDTASATVQVIFAGLAIWYAVSKREENGKTE